MPCCEAARVWQILGAALQLIGTFVALWALVGLHRDFGQGDLWPAWSNFWRGSDACCAVARTSVS
jgi:hypothetical protein